MKTSLTCGVNGELGFRLNGITEKNIYIYICIFFKPSP